MQPLSSYTRAKTVSSNVSSVKQPMTAVWLTAPLFVDVLLVEFDPELPAAMQHRNFSKAQPSFKEIRIRVLVSAKMHCHALMHACSPGSSPVQQLGFRQGLTPDPKQEKDIAMHSSSRDNRAVVAGHLCTYQCTQDSSIWGAFLTLQHICF